MMKNKFFINLFSFLIICVFGVSVVSAQQTPPNNPSGNVQNVVINPTIPNPLRTGDNISDFMKTIVEEVVLPIGGVLAVLAFIWSGFKFVTAQGNGSQIEEARRALFYTAIGTAILLGAVALTAVISNTVDAIKTP